MASAQEESSVHNTQSEEIEHFFFLIPSDKAKYIHLSFAIKP